MLTREEFLEAFTTLRVSLERRRKRYLLQWYVQTVMAASLLVAGPGYPRASLEWLADKLHRAAPVSGTEVAAFVFFAICMSVVLVVAPLIGYRGGVKPEFSIQRVVWLRLCAWLGEAELSSMAASFRHIALESGLFPADAGVSESVGIRGEMGGISYFIQEMAVSSALAGVHECVFKGLFVVCKSIAAQPRSAFNKSDRVLLLHRDFIAQEALLQAGWDEPRLHEVSLLEAMSITCVKSSMTNEKTPYSLAWQKSVLPLVHAAAALPLRRMRLDSWLLHHAQVVMGRLQGGWLARSERPALEAELSYDAQFTVPHAVVHALQIEKPPFHAAFGAAIIGDISVVALPSPATFFSPASVFEPSITREEASFIYDLASFIPQNTL